MADIRDATPADAGRVYELLDARSRAAFGISELSRDRVEDDFRRSGIDRFVAEEDGRIVGYAQLTPGRVLVHAALDEHVGDALLTLVERHARGRGFDTIEATVVPEDRPPYELVRRNGFTHERDILRMWRALGGADLPEPTWPVGVTVRAYEAADARRVQALVDAAYAAWDPSYVPQLHDEWLAIMTDHDEFDPELWFLVERDGELVACALHWREQQRRGWVKDLVVRASDRGAGLGSALLHLGLRAYKDRGVERVGLKVDSTNPTGAFRLYTRLGFEVDRRYGVWRKQL